MTDALVPSDDVAALEGLPVNEIDAALGVVWHSFGRRTVVDAWHIGRGLRRVKDGRGRHFAPYCERIKMTRSWAYNLLKLADSPLAEVSCHCHRTVDGAVKALKAAPEPTPAPVEAAPESAEPEPTPAPAAAAVEAAPVDPDPDPEDVIDAVAAEATPDPAALREGRLERLAIITEHLDGDVVDAWADRFDRQAAREREHVAANRASAKRERAWKRERADICDAMLTLPPSPEVDALLAKFFNVARKAA